MIETDRLISAAPASQQEEALDAITRGLINKIAHGPISELRKSAADATSEVVADSVRRLFRLTGPSGDPRGDKD